MNDESLTESESENIDTNDEKEYQSYVTRFVEMNTRIDQFLSKKN